MFLTSPFIDQAITQACAVCSPERYDQLHPKPAPPVNRLGLANESSPGFPFSEKFREPHG